MTGADGALGSRVVRLLDGRDVRRIDRTRGHELARPSTYAPLVRGCDAIVHTAALHPLVARPDAGWPDYRDANVVPFEALLEVARRERVRRLVLVSSTSVWRAAAAGEPARFLDETVAPDADDPYARSKRECERLAHAAPGAVVVRLARFARRDDREDDVRLLFRAVDPDDAAAAVVAALDRAADGALYAISAPTPFQRGDASELARDPAAVIRRRTGREPAWVPPTIGSVVLADRAVRELDWRARYPSPLYAPPT